MNIGWKRSFLKIRYHPGIFVKELRKIKKLFNRHSHNRGHDLNPDNYVRDFGYYREV